MVNIKTLLDKAASSERSEPDWESILDIVEEIKQKNVSVKNAVKEIRKKLLDPNSTVVYYTLQVLDSVMKNCASDVHKEILSQEFMGVMKSVITSSRDGKSDRAIDKALELIGEWKAAFGSRAGYKAVTEVFGELEREGFFIPEPQVASASFIKPAPEWVMGDRCHMCRQEFNRLKGWFPHHCRNCGKSVCTQCSTKRAPLPEFGIKQPTRVCDICYKSVASEETTDTKAKTEGASASSSSSDLPEEYLKSSLAKEPQVAQASTEQIKMREEDDFQLAIAMSLNEQDNKKKPSSSSRKEVSPAPPPTLTTPSAPPPSTPSLYSSIAQEAADTAAASSTLYSVPQDHPVPQQPTTSAGPTNLAHYLDRGYWERRKDQQAPGGAMPPPPTQSEVTAVGPPVTAGSATGSALPDTVRSTVEQFVHQLRTVSGAGGGVATDPVILSLYQTLNALHPQLLKQIDDVQQQKTKQEKVLHKINEAKTARAALNAMRREHVQKLRQQEEEQTILARMQMEQKLALLRQQKQEQLAYQQSLQQKRLDNMHVKRQEYESHLASQREQERQQLIAQEQQVIQRQLRDHSPVHMQVGGGGGGAALPQQQTVQPQYQPGPPVHSLDPSATISLQTLALHDPTVTHQAPPLPSKLDHNVAADPRPLSLPPPYHPLPSATHTPAFQTMPTIQQVVYTDPAHAPPPGNHGDPSLWVNNPAPSLHPMPHLQPSPSSTPPQLHSPSMTSGHTLDSAQPVGGAYSTQPVSGAYSAHYSHYQTTGPTHQLQSLPQPPQLYQPPANFGNQPTMDHMPPQQTIVNQQQQLPGQQPMSMQPLTMHGLPAAPPPMGGVTAPPPMGGVTAPPPMGGIKRQESGPLLITFD